MNEATKRQLWRILLLGLSVLALVYIVYQVYLATHQAVRTEVARQATVNDTVSAETFVVRNEKYLETSSNGIIIPLVSSGSRVAAGEGVVAVFDSEEAASNYAELARVQENLDRYNRLNKRKNSYAVNLSAMSKQISKSVIDLASIVDGGNLSGMQEQVYDIRDQLLTRQIATGDNVSLETKVTELQSRFNALSNRDRGYETLVSENSGFYIDSADGYERTVSYKNVQKLKPENIKKLMKADPEEVSEKVIGRVSSDFDWYLLCTLASDKAKTLKSGDTVTIELPYSAVSSVEAKVVSKSKASDGKETAVVFKCNRMNSYIASLRKEQAEILLKTYTGLKVPAEAVTTDKNGNEGVYVLEGNIARFKKLRTVYSEEDYLISSETAEEGEKGSFVKLYDAIILGGKDLYDGKILD